MKKTKEILLKFNCIFICIILFVSTFVFSSCNSLNHEKEDSSKDNQQETNEEESEEQTDEKENALVVSKEGGVYKYPFFLRVLPSKDTNIIYYTTDYSLPTEDSAIFPEKGLAIKDVSKTASYPVGAGVLGTQGTKNYNLYHGTTVRLLETEESGKVVARKTISYFVGEDADKFLTLPNVFLTVDVSKFVGPMNDCIYNLNQPYRDKCPPYIKVADYKPSLTDSGFGILEYYGKGNKESFSSSTKLKASGAYSILNSFRTLNLNFNKDENGVKNEKMNIPLYGDVEKADGTGKLTNFSNFRLHSGGSVMKDACLTSSYVDSLASTTSSTVAKAMPCNAFINGEYWGMYIMREHFSDIYFSDNYSVNKDNVIYVDKGSNLNNISITDNEYLSSIGLNDGVSYKTYRYQIGDAKNSGDVWKDLKELYDFLYKEDFTKDSVYQKFCQMVDVKSLCDTILTQAYCGNWDYMNNNFRMWRTQNIEKGNPYADTRWRLILHDTDYGFEADNSVSTQMSGSDSYGNYTILDYFFGVKDRNNKKVDPINSLIVSKPLENESFRTLMKERALFISKSFSSRAESVLNNLMTADVLTAYGNSVERWGITSANNLKKTMEKKESRCKEGGNQNNSDAYFPTIVNRSIQRFLDTKK